MNKKKVLKLIKNIAKGILLFIKSFMYKGDDPQPVYVYVGILMFFVFRILYLKIEKKATHISDFLIVSILGFILGWLSIFNWNVKIKNGFKKVVNKVKNRKAQI